MGNNAEKDRGLRGPATVEESGVPPAAVFSVVHDLREKPPPPREVVSRDTEDGELPVEEAVSRDMIRVLPAWLHSEPCPDGKHCRKVDATHMIKYLHPQPTSPDDLRPCKRGTFCRKFFSEAHMMKKWHPHRSNEVTVCRCPVHCPYLRAGHEDHAQHFSHACEMGAACSHVHDPSHLKLFFHISRRECPHGTQCDDRLLLMPLFEIEAHFEVFSHRGIPDYRRRCSEGMNCHKRRLRDLEHLKNRSHKEHLHWSKLPIPIDPRLNRGDDVWRQEVNFIENHKKTIRKIGETMKLTPDDLLQGAGKEIKEWMARCVPIHRCNSRCLEYMFVHNVLLSWEDLIALPTDVELQCSDFVTRETFALHKKLARTHSPESSEIQAYLEAVFRLAVEKRDMCGGPLHRLQRELELAKSRLQLSLKTHTSVAENAKRMVDSAVGISRFPLGLGYPPDCEMGTNMTVSTIIGPNTGKQYGGVALKFHPIVSYHPSSSTSCAAASSYRKNLSSRLILAVPWRVVPGVEPPKDDKASRPRVFPVASAMLHKAFHTAKSHPAFPGGRTAMALELYAKAQFHLGPTPPLTMDHVKTLYAKKQRGRIESHSADGHLNHFNWFQGQLPSRIPLHYVEKIYLSEKAYRGLTRDCLVELKERFPSNRVTVEIVPDLEEIMETESVLVNRADNTYYGLCFGLKSLKTERFLPMCLLNPDGSKVFHVYFEAIGGRWALFFGTTGLNEDCRPPPVEERRMLGIFFGKEEVVEEEVQQWGASRHFVYNTDLLDPKGVLRRSSFLSDVRNFNRGVNESEFVYYHLLLDLDSGVLRLEHYGPSRLLNGKVLKLSDPAVVHRDLNYISLASFGEVNDRPFIRNFRVLPPPTDDRVFETGMGSFQSSCHSTVDRGLWVDEKVPGMLDPIHPELAPPAVVGGLDGDVANLLHELRLSRAHFKAFEEQKVSYADLPLVIEDAPALRQLFHDRRVLQLRFIRAVREKFKLPSSTSADIHSRLPLQPLLASACRQALDCWDVIRSPEMQLDQFGRTFDHSRDRCYCPDCTSPGQRTSDSTAGLRHSVPVGWTKFGIAVSPVNVDRGCFSRFAIAYHGTAAKSVSCILRSGGDLLLPGDIAQDDKKVSLADEGRVKDPQWAKRIFASPSVKYASLRLYAKPFAHSHGQYQFVFELRVKPPTASDKTFRVHAETVGARRRKIEIDPDFSNLELEWATNRHNIFVILGLLVRRVVGGSDKKKGPKGRGV